MRKTALTQYSFGVGNHRTMKFYRIPVILLAAFLAATPLLRAEDAATNPPPPAIAKSPLPSGNSTNEPTIITADQLHGDYMHNVGTFEGNVLAVDPRMTVRGDKMTVFFGSTNIVATTGATTTTNSTRAVQKIIAEGGVVITTPDNKKTNSDRAEYTAGDGKVVLTGHPRAESADGIVTGNKITFWRDSQRMDVENSQTETNRPRLLIYPEDQRKQNEGGDVKGKDSSQ
jgi:lipopolysaccharide transport protein LptA